MVSLERFPERIYNQLVILEDDYSRVRDGVFGTLSEISQDINHFLKEYEPYAPQ